MAAPARPAPAYAAARLAALAPPLDPRVEAPALERAAERLRRLLGLDAAHAALEARRCVLLRRDRRVHEVLALEATPAALAAAVAATAVEGLRARPGPGRRGLLLVSLHYGPYTSLLWLALAAAASRGLLPPLAFLVDLGLDPGLALPPERLAELEAARLLAPAALSLLDARACGGPAAWRRLRALLAGGGAAVVFADPCFLAADDRRALPLPLGRGLAGVPRGVDWLARASGCDVAAVHVRPAGDAHRVAVEPAADARAALTALGAVVAAEPAPWEGWLRDQPHL